MTTLIKFKTITEFYDGRQKIIDALKKAKLEEKVIDKFIDTLKGRRKAITDAYSRALLKQPKLNAVAKKHGPDSPEYKAACLKAVPKVLVELILSGGKPFLMVGKLVVVP